MQIYADRRLHIHTHQITVYIEIVMCVVHSVMNHDKELQITLLATIV